MNNTDFKLTLASSAVNKIASVLKTKTSKHFFRIEIGSGGCAGFSISFKIDDIIQNDDLIIKEHDITVVINKKIAEFIKEAELTYNVDILNSYFNLDVKTAKNKCSCGTSFSL